MTRRVGDTTPSRELRATGAPDGGPQKRFGRQDTSPGGASDRRDSSEPPAGQRDSGTAALVRYARMRYGATGSVKPFTVMGGAASAATRPRTASNVVSFNSVSFGSAAAQSRAARFTGAPTAV